MIKQIVLSLLIICCLNFVAQGSFAVTDYTVNLIDKGTVYVNKAGNIQEEVSSKMNKYMNIKIGVPGDAKAVQKATEKAQRIKEKADKYQEKADKMQKKVAKAKEKAGAFKAASDEMKQKAAKVREDYLKAMVKVNEAKELAEEVDGVIEDAKAEYDNVKDYYDGTDDAITSEEDNLDTETDTTEEFYLEENSIDYNLGTEYQKKLAADKDSSAVVNINKIKTVSPQNKLITNKTALSDIPNRTLGAKANAISAINQMIDTKGAKVEIDENMSIIPEVSETLLPQQELTAQEVLSNAKNINFKHSVEKEQIGKLNLEEQLEMMDSTKVKKMPEINSFVKKQEVFDVKHRLNAEPKKEFVGNKKIPARQEFGVNKVILKGEADD